MGRKFLLKNGRPGAYAGIRHKKLNGVIPLSERVEVMFGPDMTGECDDDVDMSHFIRDRIMEEIIEEEPVVEPDVEPDKDPDKDPETDATDGEDVVPVDGSTEESGDKEVENVEAPVDVAASEETVDAKSEDEPKEKKKTTPVVRKRRGRKPKAKK